MALVGEYRFRGKTFCRNSQADDSEARSGTNTKAHAGGIPETRPCGHLPWGEARIASSAWFPSSFRSHSKRLVFLFYHHSGCLFHSGFLALTRDQEAQREDSPESSRCPGLISNLHGSRLGLAQGIRQVGQEPPLSQPQIRLELKLANF